MVLITIVTGGYKPTYNWGAPHCRHRFFGDLGCFLHKSPNQIQPGHPAYAEDVGLRGLCAMLRHFATQVV
jgi:hypothetical protein